MDLLPRSSNFCYWNLPIAFVEIDLDVLEILTNTMKSDEMMFARKLMDEKVPVWK